MQIAVFSILIFIANIPFGYWRANVKVFSLQWFLAVHLPVPAIIAVRLYSKIGFEWYTYIFAVTAFFVGQYFGKILNRWFKRKHLDLISSCLFMDVCRFLFNCRAI